MNHTKHTPGPWRVNGRAIEHDDEYGLTAVLVHVYTDDEATGLDHGEGEANARLIAAAPDLLAACEGLIATDAARGYEMERRGRAFLDADECDYSDARARARAAIVRARGGTAVTASVGAIGLDEETDMTMDARPIASAPDLLYAPDLLCALDALRRVAYDVENYVLITTPQLRSDLRDALRAADAACLAVTGETGETGARARGGMP